MKKLPAKRSYSDSTIKILFGSSGNRCAFPDCSNPIIASETEFSSPLVLAQVCHIYAASTDGPRGNPGLTTEQRNLPWNLILLCPTHHRIVDGQHESFPAETLKRWKKQHEGKFKRTILAAHEGHPSLVDEPRTRFETIQDLIKLKCFTDFEKSAISSLQGLDEAKAAYEARLHATALKFSDVNQFNFLADFDWLRNNLVSILDDHATAGRSFPIRISRAVRKLERFIKQERRPLRISCGISLGPIATICSLRDSPHLGLGIDLEILDPNGVELMQRAARYGESNPYDFFFTPTGAFNLTLVANCHTTSYRPSLPIHYNEQVSLFRPSRNADKEPKAAIFYDLSSGHEEYLVRKDAFPVSELQLVSNFDSLVDMLNGIDDNVVVNIWDPLAKLLVDRAGWAKAFIPPYQFLTCLYEHKRFSSPPLSEVGTAFKEVFIYQWNLLRQNKPQALRYLMLNEPLINTFTIGSGWYLRADPRRS